MFLYIFKKVFIWFICTIIWCGSSDVLLLGSKQELVFRHLLVLVIEKTLQDKLYIKCLMSPLSRPADLMVDIIERVRDHERGNE
jgi:hypothetical protein